MPGKKKALFLDRDGVINLDKGYVYQIEEFEFIDGIFDLCIKAKESGYLLIIVTNQSGIGREYYSEDDFHTLMNWVKGEFSKRGVEFDGVYFCPFHAEHGVGEYKKESENRKPNPGMILDAISDFDIDAKASLMVGDKEKDVEAAQRAGLGQAILYSDSVDNTKADKLVGSLEEIVDLL